MGLTVAVSLSAQPEEHSCPSIDGHFSINASLGGCIATLLPGGIVCQVYAPETSNKK